MVFCNHLALTGVNYAVCLWSGICLWRVIFLNLYFRLGWGCPLCAVFCCCCCCLLTWASISWIFLCASWNVKRRKYYQCKEEHFKQQGLSTNNSNDTCLVLHGREGMLPIQAVFHPYSSEMETKCVALLRQQKKKRNPGSALTEGVVLYGRTVNIRNG